MFQSIRQSWRQSLAALMFLGVASSSGDSVLLAADDPFASEVVAKDDTKSDRQPVQDEDDDDDDDKKSVKGKKDDDDRDTKPVKKGDDDDLKYIKRNKKGDDEKGESLDELRAKLRQLEADNAKLRSAIEQKDAALGIKKAPERKGNEKLPPLKSTKPVDPPPQKGGEKQVEEQQRIVAKLKAVQEQIGQLQKEGRKEEAEKLTHAAQEMQHALAERQAKHGKGPKDEASALGERIEQLKREIEESARNGQKERVDDLHRELEKTIYHAQQMQKKGFAKPEPEHHAELGAVLKELSAEVQRLRAEVNELRQIVKDRGDDRKK